MYIYIYICAVQFLCGLSLRIVLYGLGLWPTSEINFLIKFSRWYVYFNIVVNSLPGWNFWWNLVEMITHHGDPLHQISFQKYDKRPGPYRAVRKLGPHRNRTIYMWTTNLNWRSINIPFILKKMFTGMFSSLRGSYLFDYGFYFFLS